MNSVTPPLAFSPLPAAAPGFGVSGAAPETASRSVERPAAGTTLLLAADAPATRNGAAAPGLVTSAISSRLFAATPAGPGGKVRKATKPQVKRKKKVTRGRGFPGAELIGHVRDHFGPEVDAAGWENARDRSPFMSPQRAAAADWDGGQSIEWSLYLSPGAVRIGSHDPQARERAAARACLRREASVKALYAIAEFADAVREVGARHTAGEDPTAAYLAAEAREAAERAVDHQLLADLEPFFLLGPDEEATRRIREGWWQRVIDTARLYPDGVFPDPSTRGRIFGLSAKARNRMTYTLAAIDYTPLMEHAGARQVPIHTLTYGDDWLSVAPDGRVFHEHMDLFWRLHERAWGRTTKVTRYLSENGKPVATKLLQNARKAADLLENARQAANARQLPDVPEVTRSSVVEAELKAAGVITVVTEVWKGDRILAVWKLEFQRRGAPHVHVFMVEPDGRARVPERGIRPVGAGCTYKTWLSRVWNHIAYGSAPCEDWLSGGKCGQPLRQLRDDKGQPVVEDVVMGKDANGEPILVPEPVETGCRGRHEVRQAAIERHQGARRCPHAVAKHREAHERAGTRCTRTEAAAHLPGPDQPCDQAEDHIARDAARHLNAGTGVDYDSTRGITDPASAARYFAKHGQFNAKRYQDEMPEEWKASEREASQKQHSQRSQWRQAAKAELEEIEEASGLPEGWIETAESEDEDGNSPGTGRIWGYKGLKKAETPTRVTPAEAVTMGRTLRKLARSMDSTVLVEETRKVTDRHGDVHEFPTGRKLVEARTTRGGTWSPEKPGANHKRHGARHGGKHANPRMAFTTVERYEGGKAELVSAAETGITYWTTDDDGNRVQEHAPVQGLAALQYLQPVKVTRRKSVRRMHRFRNNGTPSGWMIVPDGESVGSALAASLGQAPRVELGLAAGLKLAAPIAAPPVRPGPYSRSAAELRARLAHLLVPAGVDPTTGEITEAPTPTPRLSAQELAARFRAKRSATVPDRSSARHTAPRYTNLRLAEDTATAKRACVDCGHPIATALQSGGTHFGCTPNPLISRADVPVG